jgi:hypothetical protein
MQKGVCTKVVEIREKLGVEIRLPPLTRSPCQQMPVDILRRNHTTLTQIFERNPNVSSQQVPHLPTRSNPIDHPREGTKNPDTISGIAGRGLTIALTVTLLGPPRASQVIPLSPR